MIPVMDIESIDITYEQWLSACIQAEARAVESEEVQSVQRSAAPVSYTHLTLPTKA